MCISYIHNGLVNGHLYIIMPGFLTPSCMHAREMYVVRYTQMYQMRTCIKYTLISHMEMYQVYTHIHVKHTCVRHKNDSLQACLPCNCQVYTYDSGVCTRYDTHVSGYTHTHTHTCPACAYTHTHTHIQYYVCIQRCMHTYIFSSFMSILSLSISASASNSLIPDRDAVMSLSFMVSFTCKYACTYVFVLVCSCVYVS